MRAGQVPDPGSNSYFLRAFGRSERVTRKCACERSGDVSLPNVLHLICGDTITAKLNNGSGWLAKRLKEEKDDAKLLDELFLACLLAKAERAAKKRRCWSCWGTRRRVATSFSATCSGHC